jgi:DNA repair protein RadC
MGNEQGTMVSLSGETICNTMNQIADHAKQAIGHKSIEHFMAYFIGTIGECIGAELIATGTATEVAPDMRAILDHYQAYNALGMVAVHNHPNGYAMPSMQDVSVTQYWLELGQEIGFNLIDSVVVARNDVTSIRSMVETLDWPGQ